MAVVKCPECSDKFEVSSDKINDILQCPTCFHQFFFMTPQQQAAAKKRQDAVEAAAKKRQDAVKAAPKPAAKPKKPVLTHEQKVEKLLFEIRDSNNSIVVAVWILAILAILAEISGFILYFQLVD